MNKILILFALAVPALSARAQAVITLAGKVVMAAGQTPLSFASISIDHSPLGTVTNADGEFEFHFPESYADDTLVVSFIGFESFRGAIAGLRKQNTNLTLALRAQSLVLREIVVQAKDLSGKEIVEKAIKKMPENYPTQLFRLEGFFREIEAENEHYTLLSEAALMLDDDFTKRKNSYGETVTAQDVRQSYKYSVSGRRNRIAFALMDLLENNDVRYRRGMLNPRYYTYQYDSITTYNDRPVYIVRARNHVDEGTLYIDVETFAFLRIEALRKSRKAGAPYYQVYPMNDSVRIGRKTFSFSVDFQLYKNKMYVKHMQEHETEDYYDAKTKTVTTLFEETLEFIVTNIHTNVPRREGVVLNRNTDFVPGPYNEDFWKDYNIMKLSPLSERLIRDLEKQATLQQQFQANQH